MQNQVPEVSIILRALNEERWLPEVFAALHRQKFRDFEVILIDSGSIDRTRDIAAANGARILRLRPEDFTFGHSLNVGIKEARGELMAIISAHAIPSDENWLNRLVAPLRNPDVAMVYGGQRAHQLTKFSEARDFERVFPDQSYEIDPEHPFANNANSAVKRSLWLEHPFDEGLPGLEDIEWAKHWLERGRKVLYTPESCIIHVHTESWPQVRRRYYREGMAARWVGLLIQRSIPGEVFRELRWGIADLWHALRAGRLLALAPEIFRFRYEKTLGTVGGVTDSRGLTNPARRAELYFGRGFPALVIKGPNRLHIEDRTVPTLKPGEVLVRVSHVGICGTDLEVVDGTLGYFRSGKAHYPIVPGHEFSGTVVTLGPKVTEVAPGDRVVIEPIQGCGECADCRRDDAIRCVERREVGVVGQDGACAAYMVTRARYAHRVPEGLALAKAALTEPLAVVHKGLRRLGYSAKDQGQARCAVIGGGAIGHLAALVLKLRGHQVTVFDQDRERLNAFPADIRTAMDLKGLGEFDWIVECTGRSKALSAVLEQSSSGSSVLLLGFPYAEQNFNFENLVSSDLSVVGSVGSSRRDFDEALRILPQLDTSAFQQAAYPFEEYDKAFAAARAHASLKIMLAVDPSDEPAVSLQVAQMTAA